jgi:hypothetical protein
MGNLTWNQDDIETTQASQVSTRDSKSLQLTESLFISAELTSKLCYKHRRPAKGNIYSYTCIHHARVPSSPLTIL